MLKMLIEGDKKLLFLFGLPGSGKNHVGEFLSREPYNFHFYDADDDHTPRQVEAKRLCIPFDFPTRVEFYEVIRPKIMSLLNLNRRLAVANFFAYDIFRRQYLQEFPGSKFVLIETDEETRIRQIKERPEKKVSDELAISMSSQFEPISIPHTIIKNDGNKEYLRVQLDALVVK